MLHTLSDIETYAVVHRHIRPRNLTYGEIVTHPDMVPSVANGAFFYYQVNGDRGRSRVMCCDSEGEREFIIEQIGRGNEVRYCTPAELASQMEDVAVARDIARKSAARTLLSGEVVKSPEWLRIELKKGPFSYQVLSRPPSKIGTCSCAATADILADHIKEGTRVVIRR